MEDYSPSTMHYEALLAVCKKRSSVRTFSSRAVPHAVVQRVIDLAATSPFASGRKNWEVMVVSDQPTRDRMAALVKERVEVLQARVREDFRRAFVEYAESFSSFASAPVIFVPTFRTSHTLPPMEEDPCDPVDLHQWERDNVVKSIACVAMLVLLAAEAQGLGACCMTGPLLAEPALAEVIGARKGRSLGALIPMGYRAIEGDPEYGH